MYYTIFLTILLIVSAEGGEWAGRARRGGSGGGQRRDRQARVQERRQGLQAAEFGLVGAVAVAVKRAREPAVLEVIILYIIADPLMWDRYLSLGSRFLKIEHEFCSFFIIILCKQVCFIRSCECSLLVKSFASTCWISVFDSPLMRMLILLGNRQESYLLSIPRPLFHRGFESRSGQEPVFFYWGTGTFLFRVQD